MMLRNVLGLSALLSFSVAADAVPVPQAGTAPKYVIAPVPAWVVASPPTDSKQVHADSSTGAVRYVLLDRQVRVQESSARYSRVVLKMLNQAGVESQSQIQIRFDPEKDKLSVHAVTIQRGTEIIDQLKTGRIEVLQREDGLEEGVLDGNLTFHLLLNDVRVGDTLQYSYTIDHRDPEWGNRFYARYTTRWDDPVEHSRLRILTREAEPLHILNHDGAQPIRKVGGGWQSLEWTWSDIPALASVSDVPVGYEQHPSIQLSQFASWQEVAEVARPLYVLPAHESPERAALVARFRSSGASDAERMLAAIRFVQEEIRYTGIELGQGAYRPRSPDQVLTQRFGDCKDKALLAVALLKGLGIEAAPALVSTDWRAQLRARQPSPEAMNHVIVRVRLGASVYWFDVTATAQGGDLAHFTQSNLGAGLVIAPGVTALETIPARAAEQPLVTSTAIFNLRDGLDHEAGLAVATLYRGSDADWMRHRLRTTTAEELGRQYLNYYKGRYPGIRAQAPPQFKDDLTANEVTVDESYRVDHPFAVDSRGRMVFDVDAESISEHLKTPGNPVRTIPLALDFPIHVVQQIEIEMPEDWPVKDVIENIESPEFHFDSRVSREGNDIHLDYRYRTTTDQVPVDHLADFLEKREKARGGTGFSLSYNPSITATTAQIDEAAKALQEAARLARDGAAENAAHKLAALMVMPGYPGLSTDQQHSALYLSGAVAFDRQDWPHALAFLQQSSVMDGADADEWLLRLRAAAVAGNHADATQSLGIVAQRWPQSLRSVDDSLVGQTVAQTPVVGSGRYVLLKALADAHYARLDGGNLSAWWCDLGLRQLERGEQDAALATLRQVDSAYALIGMRADKRYDAIRDRLGIPLDVAAALQREIDTARQQSGNKGPSLKPILLLADALIRAQRYDEALQVLDPAIARERAAGKHGESADRDREYVWILDTRSRALQHLGRWDDALAQLVEASHLPEGKSDNVSQVINLAGLYNDLGRPRDALAALEGLGAAGVSPYGQMQVENEGLRSALQLGDSAAAERHLGYMRGHSADAIGTYQSALANAGHDQEAADFLRSRLANQDQRAAALLELQRYVEGTLTPQTREESRRWQLLLDRDDVKAAVAKVGAIDSYPILAESR